MDTIILGNTGLRTTIAGLGCGGFSRIGIQKYGVDHAAGIVRTAYDEGVNFFDTAAAYGTEGAVGQGLAGLPRDSYILSTKYPYRRSGDWRANGAADLMESLENSLRELRTDHVDIYHLHGVTPEDYADARDILLPAMQKAREQGKLRFLGITELFGTDTSHEAFKISVPENLFDVIMVGYNMLNPSAAKEILPKAAELGIGVLCMFAVRSALSNPDQLVTDIGRIIAKGQAGEGLAATKGALDFLVSGDAPPAASIMEAAYRFCRHTPPIHVVLTGTGDAGHLRENLRSIASGPLPRPILDRLEALFGRVDCISGQ
ncbi:MAG: aldo/keto reductase [Oscillospiraceae bacterium]|nr:aldo/keto reductase [Oscillospiraceae bacterium]